MSYQAVRDARQQSEKEFAELRQAMIQRAVKTATQRALAKQTSQVSVVQRGAK